MEKTNKIELHDHGIMLQDYFHGTSGVMISIHIDNETKVSEVIEMVESEINLLFDHIIYTAEYHGFTGDLDKTMDKVLKDLKRENKDRLNEIVDSSLDWDFNTENQDDIDCNEYPVLILSLEFYQDDFYDGIERFSMQDINNMKISKGELFKELEKEKTFDYALPQQWLNDFVDWSYLNYNLVRSTTVWVYPESMPLSLCNEVQDKIDYYQNMKY